MEPIESSETSAYINTLTPGTYPKEKKLQVKVFLIGVCGFNLWRHSRLRRFELRVVVKQILALYSLKFFEVISKGLKKITLLMLFREVIAVYCEYLTKSYQVHLFSYPALLRIQFTLFESVNFQNCVLHVRQYCPLPIVLIIFIAI